MKSNKGYQKDLSRTSPILLDKEYKAPKAKKIMTIIDDFTGGDTSGLSCVDIGSSAGAITAILAGSFKVTIGVDIDFAALKQGARDNDDERLSYILGDSMTLPFANDSIDVIVCNQIYEHVPDAGTLFDEIHRVLKRSGFCFLGATNRLKVKEPHYHLYFLSWLPKPLAHLYMRLSGRGGRYYEDLRTCFGLKALLKRFDVIDYTVKVLQDPKKYCATDVIKEGSLITRLPVFLYSLFYFAIPTYIWILKKRGD